jgi:hypothetical protein
LNRGSDAGKYLGPIPESNQSIDAPVICLTAKSNSIDGILSPSITEWISSEVDLSRKTMLDIC